MDYFAKNIFLYVAYAGLAFFTYSQWICFVIYQLECLLAGHEIWRYSIALG